MPHLLFLSRPDRGHLYPTLGLAEELGRRGHRVTFATGDAYADEAAGPGVRLLRFGQHEANLLDMPSVLGRGRVDAVVADPRTVAAAADLAPRWDAPVVVAGTVLPPGHDWPGEEGHDRYVFTLPGTRGAVHDPWRPGGRRPVLLVDGAPIGPLVRAFADTEWQVVIGDPCRFAGLPYADVFLTDGRLPAISAGLRAGVPMLLAPSTVPEVTNAAQVVALGAGSVVVLSELPAEALLETVEHLRVDERTAAAARRVAARIEALGAPATAADQLEGLLAPPAARAA